MPNWLTVVLLFLPAGVANATPVVANKIPLLNQWQTPLDFGLKLRGKRLFGANKRWRGVVAASFLAALTAILLSPLLDTGFSLAKTAGIGALLGLGAMIGDAIESCFKRQRGVPAGSRWFPFDQIDYIIGGLLFVAPFGIFSISDVVLIFVVFFGLHLLFAYIAFAMGLKDKPI